MSEQLITYVLFVIGFLFLIKGADVMVNGASSIAKRLNVSDLVVGLTVVSFGTSAPELIINVLSSIQGSSDIAIGNIFGSNIANILLILGISAIIHALPIHRNTVLSEIPFSLTATLLVGYLANAALFQEGTGLEISRYDGGVLLFFFFLFMAYIFKVSKESGGESDDNSDGIEELPLWKAITFVVVGMLALFLGGKWVVDGAIDIAKIFGLSESLIGLTVVAVGTSLPELVTSAVAAFKRNTDIAVGNVVGSNIFNLLWILGISSLINPLPFDLISNEDIMMIIFASTLLIIAMAVGKKYTIQRWNGILFLIIYVAYTIFLVYRG